MRARALLGMLAITLATARAATAQPEPSASGLKMAQDLVEEGRALGQQGKWGEALERFRKAAGVSPKMTAQLSFYVGYAEARVGKLVEADVDLRRAVELAHGGNTDQVAKAARAELPELEARTPGLTIVVNGTATPTGLEIDGGPLGVAALGSSVPLDPGDHTIVVRFAGGPVTRQVTLAERQRATVTIDAPSAPGAVGSPPPPENAVPGAATSAPGLPTTPPPDATTGGSGRKVLGFVVLGVGGATLVTSGVFYLLARSALSPVTSACPSSPCSAPSGSPLPGDYHDAQTKQTVSIVLAGAGGAIAVAGVVLLATGGSGAAASTAASTQLAPWVGPGAGGASLAGSF
ncbi:MAG: hypothetical protein ABSE49_29010 [Polyangiaceae bacterium]